MDPAVAAARRHVREHGAEVLGELAELAAIPHVSSDLDGVRRNAEWLLAALTERGVAARLHELEGVAPLVVGHLEGTAPGPRQRIGLYVHYDGQPVEPVADWTFPPFEPTLTDRALADGGEVIDLPAPGEPVDPEWRLYARGTGDDRAPAIALLAALDALEDAGVDRTVDLVVAFEGEEEIGSPHLGDHLRALGGELAADVWIVCDGPVHHSRRPQVVFGVRGYCGLELTVFGPDHDVHSGHYGNWAPNPALQLAHLLASMRTPDGRVLVAGYEDDTVAPTPATLAAVAALPDDDEQLAASLALGTTEGDDEERLVARLLRPSLNVRGLAAGAVGEDARNVVPTTATASIDIRLAPGDDAATMLDRIESHLRDQGAHVVHDWPDPATRRDHPLVVHVEREEGYPGLRTPVDHAAAVLVLDAVRRAHGEPVVQPTFGGSVPMHPLASTTGAPLVILPIANHDDNQHAPDENLRVGNLLDGVVRGAADGMGRTTGARGVQSPHRRVSRRRWRARPPGQLRRARAGSS